MIRWRCKYSTAEAGICIHAEHDKQIYEPAKLDLLHPACGVFILGLRGAVVCEAEHRVVNGLDGHWRAFGWLLLLDDHGCFRDGRSGWLLKAGLVRSGPSRISSASLSRLLSVSLFASAPGAVSPTSSFSSSAGGVQY
jgi:hypothetical protein